MTWHYVWSSWDNFLGFKEKKNDGDNDDDYDDSVDGEMRQRVTSAANSTTTTYRQATATRCMWWVLQTSGFLTRNDWISHHNPNPVACSCVPQNAFADINNAFINNTTTTSSFFVSSATHRISAGPPSLFHYQLSPADQTFFNDPKQEKKNMFAHAWWLSPNLFPLCISFVISSHLYSSRSVL